MTFAQSEVWVNSYYRSNGTYVSGYYRTAPNNTVNDNWSTIGNVNPHTGVAGTKPRATYYYNTSTLSTPSYTIAYSTPIDTKMMADLEVPICSHALPITKDIMNKTSKLNIAQKMLDLNGSIFGNTLSGERKSLGGYDNSSYNSTNTNYTRSKGGQYYSNGNKSYVHR